MDHAAPYSYCPTWQRSAIPNSRPGQYDDSWEVYQSGALPEHRLDHGYNHPPIPSLDHPGEHYHRAENSAASLATDYSDYLDEHHENELQSKDEEDIYENNPDLNEANLQENSVLDSQSVLSATEKVVLVDTNEGSSRTFVGIQSVPE